MSEVKIQNSGVDSVVKARFQLEICNSCRYCEGYCAVFPALERYVDVTASTVDFLANLCHDCRACLYACMYAPPHEFGIDIPRTLSQVRRHTWKTDLPWPARKLAQMAGPGVGVTLVVATALTLVLAAITAGIGQLWHARASAASPYGIISYQAILAVGAASFIYAIAVITWTSRRYWRRIRQSAGGWKSFRAWRAALSDAASLRYLRGGGVDCQYPTEDPSPLRRHLHAAVAYGFTACLAATISAGVLQDLLGDDPPYPLISVPVLLGSVGGIGLIAGSVGLLWLKRQSDPYANDEDANDQGRYFLVALLVLGLTGILTLALRTTPAFGPILLIHLSVVTGSFVLAPSSKFAHAPYRLLALVQYHLGEDSHG